MTKQPSDNTLSISRRKLLAGLGTVGVAAGGAGLGTSALLSDVETIVGNELQAGTLDLKLDYKSTYLGGAGRLDELRQTYLDAEDLGDGRYLLDQAPTPEEEELWETLVQDEQFDFCSEEADEFLINGDEIPIFTLDDVKPGDSGEVTLSLHICDNPAYVRMIGELVSEAENGMTEPEMDVDSTPDTGELADLIEVCVWYDEDCDNVYEPTGTGQSQELEVALVSDTSGSMSGGNLAALRAAATDFVDNLSSPDEAAAVSFSTGVSLDQALTTDYQAVKDAIDAYSAGGNTNVGGGIDVGRQELLNGANATMGASKVMIVLTDGFENIGDARTAAQMAKDAGIRVFGIGLGTNVDASLVTDISSSPDDAFFAPDPADLDTVYAEIAQVVLEGEQKIAEGSLRDVLGALATDGGVVLDGDRREDGIQCFPGATTQCIGFEWFLPVEVGNEIQTDTLSFDIGFEAEQCRHNPLERSITTETGEGFAKQQVFDAGTESSFARGRFGDNGPSGAFEVGIGTPGTPTPNFIDTANYVWTPGATVPFVLSADGAGNASFSLDGVVVNAGSLPAANGKLAITTKADESTITVENVELDLDGETVTLDGPTGVDASNDGSGREVTYLAIDTVAGDVAEPFELRGDVTVDIQGDYPGNDEGVAFDISLE